MHVLAMACNHNNTIALQWMLIASTSIVVIKRTINIRRYILYNIANNKTLNLY